MSTEPSLKLRIVRTTPLVPSSSCISQTKSPSREADATIETAPTPDSVGFRGNSPVILQMMVRDNMPVFSPSSSSSFCQTAFRTSSSSCMGELQGQAILPNCFQDDLLSFFRSSWANCKAQPFCRTTSRTISCPSSGPRGQTARPSHFAELLPGRAPCSSSALRPRTPRLKSFS